MISDPLTKEQIEEAKKEDSKELVCIQDLYERLKKEKEEYDKKSDIRIPIKMHMFDNGVIFVEFKDDQNVEKKVTDTHNMSSNKQSDEDISTWNSDINIKGDIANIFKDNQSNLSYEGLFPIHSILITSLFEDIGIYKLNETSILDSIEEQLESHRYLNKTERNIANILFRIFNEDNRTIITTKKLVDTNWNLILSEFIKESQDEIIAYVKSKWNSTH